MLALVRRLLRPRLFILVLLAGLATFAAPAVRDRAARLIACGVRLQISPVLATSAGGGAERPMDDMFGGRIRPASPAACLRDAAEATAAGRTWVRQRSRAN